jgi:1-acyl-sn-glycerol-3-phosphate acyltransferase
VAAAPPQLRLLPRHEARCLAGPPVDLSAYRGRPLTAELLREVTDEIMVAVRDLLADVRDEEPPKLFWKKPMPARGKKAVEQAPE